MIMHTIGYIYYTTFITLHPLHYIHYTTSITLQSMVIAVGSVPGGSVPVGSVPGADGVTLVNYLCANRWLPTNY